MKDMTNIMSKLPSLGSPLLEVDPGAGPDIAVLGLDRRNFGFVDSAGAYARGRSYEIERPCGPGLENVPYQKQLWKK
jgi:hypothetical protein